MFFFLQFKSKYYYEYDMSGLVVVVVDHGGLSPYRMIRHDISQKLVFNQGMMMP
jgi:hypothetical protein